jgi:hypothetical protein
MSPGARSAAMPLSSRRPVNFASQVAVAPGKNLAGDNETGDYPDV